MDQSPNIMISKLAIILHVSECVRYGIAFTFL